MAIALTGDIRVEGVRVPQPVPHSAGVSGPRVGTPPLACDCHMHVYNSRVPAASGARLLHADASVADYRQLQRRLGMDRTVVVTPSAYGFDNRVTLATMRELGSASRGIVVISPDTPEAQLDQLDSLGVVGARLNLSVGGVMTIDMLEPLALRIKRLGWHIQVALRAPILLDHERLFASLDVPLVFDHFAGVDATEDASDPALQSLVRLLRAGNAWVKLSGAYLRSRVDAANYADLRDVARVIIDTAPDRVVCGSDWPHPTQSAKPDDAMLLDLLLDWAPDARTRNAILVDNPTRLYRF